MEEGTGTEAEGEPMSRIGQRMFFGLVLLFAINACDCQTEDNLTPMLNPTVVVDGRYWKSNKDIIITVFVNPSDIPENSDGFIDYQLSRHFPTLGRVEWIQKVKGRSLKTVKGLITNEFQKTNDPALIEFSERDLRAMQYVFQYTITLNRPGGPIELPTRWAYSQELGDVLDSESE